MKNTQSKCTKKPHSKRVGKMKNYTRNEWRTQLAFVSTQICLVLITHGKDIARDTLAAGQVHRGENTLETSGEDEKREQN